MLETSRPSSGYHNSHKILEIYEEQSALFDFYICQNYLSTYLLNYTSYTLFISKGEFIHGMKT